MSQIRIKLTDGTHLSSDVQSDKAFDLAERIAKSVNNMNASGKDRLVQIGDGKYVLASLVHQVVVTHLDQVITTS
jgi:hypothetical protein